MNTENREKQWLLEEKYKGIESPEFFTDLEKLKSGTPLAYLIGNIPFLGTTIYLDSKPLIPRPETEYWVDRILKTDLQEDVPKEILDIFSGSGCIGVGILVKQNNFHVDFAELKEEHLRTIQKNLRENGIEKNRYQIFQSDLFTSIPPKTYDAIFANPPYISLQRKHTVDESVLNHEDPNALFAEDDGLLYIKQLIQAIPTFLKPNGHMYIEFDPWQKELLETYMNTTKLSYTFLHDQYERPRVLSIQNKTLA